MVRKRGFQPPVPQKKDQNIIKELTRACLTGFCCFQRGTIMIQPFEMKMFPWLILACVLSGCSQTQFYYETYRGENYESAGWKVAPNEEALGEIPDAGYHNYTRTEDRSGLVKVRRQMGTPSGDWFFVIDYDYGADGKLAKIRSEFRTFRGHDSQTDDFLPTGCLRSYGVSPAGKISLQTEEIRDLESGKRVKRAFWEPEIKHWMSVADLPKPE
jgi:hypothetical protein